jgi:hypothetical protein
LVNVFPCHNCHETCVKAFAKKCIDNFVTGFNDSVSVLSFQNRQLLGIAGRGFLLSFILNYLKIAAGNHAKILVGGRNTAHNGDSALK